MALVTCTVEDGIAQVRLSRPDKLNALTLPFLDELVATAHRLRRDKTLRAVVIAGEGDGFCAGLDFASALKDPVAIGRAFVPRPWRGTNTFQEACWAWRRLPVPVIAAVHGHCLGGGVQIALAADFRYASPDSTWSVLEGKWGIIPDMSGIRSLAELVGIDTAKRLTMTAEMFSGKEAHELGLVTVLDADPVAGATAFAQQLAGRSPDALAAAKRLFNDTWTSSPRRTFARERMEQVFLLASRNAKIAREAAFRKVAPQFGPRQR
ncbi:MAG TPA: crotonase/enoyl-CoA hydratase family protein [Nocardioides sp.]|uniref:crotonase/enoyl-CoA hydratase family protein n=1 Tax=Nocardioides sp. TaxID=35761 RepID=UPI002C55CA00|nr:crotonase/enoyl-CoA hydratase family protein [Nocardioides sp.]HQR27045.1 crotonase/enoyl-CoA hydratase family protein [Nocardioides sp.]